jgi:hypothetical protein
MPATDFLPRKLYNAFSRIGALGEPTKGLIALQGNPEYVSFWDDFMGTRSGTWPAGTPYASTVGTNTEVIGITQAIGGTMTLTTAAADGDTAGQGFGLNWNGDSGFYFIARAKMSRITLSKFEIGMTDAVNDDGAVDVKATPTFTATDCALFVFDRTDDANVTFVSNGGTADGNADASNFTLVADTYFVVEIVGRGATDTTGDNVAGYINGQLVGSGNINGANALTPWFYTETLTGASAAVTFTVDYWGCIGPRNAAWGGSV